MLECEFQDKLVNDLRKRLCYVRPLVGNMLQSGLPDLLIISKVEKLYHAELKCWRKKNPPKGLNCFVGLLEGPQKLVIVHEFWNRNQTCPIVVKDNVQEGTYYMHFGTGDIHVTNYERLVNALVHL